MSLNRSLKIKSLHYLHYWDLTCDGTFSKPRIKGDNKKLISRARRHYEKQMAKTEVGD